MAFTVSRNGTGAKDSEFGNYARLLRIRGIDLGKLPRVPEPGTGRRWLYGWDSREQAQAFADDLKKQTHDPEWTVVEVPGPAAEGPLGPIVIQIAPRSTGLVFALHPASRMIIRSVFPESKGIASTLVLDLESIPDFVKSHGGIATLAREVLPTLTGLRLSELDQLGYVLVEDNTERTLVFVPPGDLVQFGKGS